MTEAPRNGKSRINKLRLAARLALALFAGLALLIALPIVRDSMLPVRTPDFLIASSNAVEESKRSPGMATADGATTRTLPAAMRLRARFDDVFTSLTESARMQLHADVDAMTSASAALGPPPWTRETLNSKLKPLADRYIRMDATLQWLCDFQFFENSKSPDLQAWAEATAALHRELGPYAEQGNHALIALYAEQGFWLNGADVARENLGDPELERYCRRQLGLRRRAGLAIVDAIASLVPGDNLRPHAGFLLDDSEHSMANTEMQSELRFAQHTRSGVGWSLTEGRAGSVFREFESEFRGNQVILHPKRLDRAIDFEPRTDSKRFNEMIVKGPWIDEPEIVLTVPPALQLP